MKMTLSLSSYYTDNDNFNYTSIIYDNFSDDKLCVHSRAKSRLFRVMLFPFVDSLPRAHEEYGTR